MIIKGKILFHSCLQDAQEYGSDDEYMVSRIFFSLELPDKRIDNLYADIKQTVGDNFESGNLEISQPQGLKQPINYSMFRDAAETYFRSIIGKQGRGIRIEGGKNIRMFNCSYAMPMEADINIDTDKGAW